jgi:hypothetical protein
MRRNEEGKDEKDGKESDKTASKSVQTSSTSETTSTVKKVLEKPKITLTTIKTIGSTTSTTTSTSTEKKDVKTSGKKKKEKKTELVSTIAHLKNESDLKELLGDTDLAMLKEVVKPAVPYIRFPLMKMSDLGAFVSPTSVVDKNHLVTLFMTAATPAKLRIDSMYPKDFPFLRDPRDPRAISLNYVSDFDQNGIFYAIATKSKTAAWSNPYTAGKIGLVQQGTINGQLTSWGEINTPSDNFYISSGSPNILTIDLKEHKLIPTHYTLRHNNQHVSNYLGRNWRFEGSQDGIVWDVLITHVNDAKLAGGTVLTATWEIDGARKFYSRFRLTQTGNGSDNTMQYMMFNGIEIYGRARYGKFD